MCVPDGAQEHVFEIDLLERFQKDLIKAKHAYIRQTGRYPTHWVLGRTEQLQWHALIKWLSPHGSFRYSGPPVWSYQGMQAVACLEESRLLRAARIVEGE